MAATATKARPPAGERLAYPYAEAAYLLGVSYGQVRKMIGSGDLRTISIGRRRLIAADEIARVVADGGI